MDDRGGRYRREYIQAPGNHGIGTINIKLLIISGCQALPGIFYSQKKIMDNAPALNLKPGAGGEASVYYNPLPATGWNVVPRFVLLLSVTFPGYFSVP